MIDAGKRLISEEVGEAVLLTGQLIDRCDCGGP